MRFLCVCVLLCMFAAGTLAAETLSFRDVRLEKKSAGKFLKVSTSPHSLLSTLAGYSEGRLQPPELDFIRGEWDRIQKLDFGMSSLMQAQQLFFKWGARDAESALKEAAKFCEPSKGEVDLIAFAVLGWSAMDPDEAIRWVSGLKGDADEHSTVSLIQLHQMALFGLVQMERELDALGYWLEMYRSLEIEEFYEKMLDPAAQFAIASLAKRDQEKALAWIGQFGGELRENRTKALLEGVLIEIAQTDPKGAMLTAFNLPDGQLRRALFERFVRWWASDHAKEASAWLKEQEDLELVMLGVVAIIGSLVDEGFEEIKYWIETVDEPAFRNVLIHHSHEHFRYDDPGESVHMLSLYDPTAPALSMQGYSGFGNAFAWLNAMGEDLAFWSAYEHEVALEFWESIDFLDAKQQELLKASFERTLQGDYKKEYLGRLFNRVGVVAKKHGMGDWSVTSMGLRGIDLMQKEEYDDCLVFLAQYWGRYEPSVVRYLILQQTLFDDETSQRALASLSNALD